MKERIAVGTIAFHLGREVQMVSVSKGYNQEVEDRLLQSSGWEENGYLLYKVSTLAGSSSGGWLSLPTETNALFLRKSLWNEVDGYDQAFSSPGGGLANLDLWKRLCDDPTLEIVVLLGEATFHQVHGGIATNNLHHEEQLAKFKEEYRQIRGSEFVVSKREPLYFGKIPREAISGPTGHQEKPKKRPYWIFRRGPLK